jgi:hypothetical protein
MTDLTSPEAVAKMLNRLTFETVNSEINRTLASELGAMITALSAKLAETERKLESSRQIERNVQEAREFEFRRAEAAEKKLAEVTASERELSASYLRIRSLTSAFATNFGGENRFAVTEKAVSDLIASTEAAEAKLAEREAQVEKLLDAQVDEALKLEAAEAAAVESEGNLAHALRQLDDAKARATELEALVKAYEDGTVPDLTAVYIAGGKDMADKLKAAEALARDPKHAAEVLLRSDDLTIKPAAKALQDAFGLSGVGWKQYLKAFRAALRALAGYTP